MRVQFDATLEDMVDAALRLLARSRSFSLYRWSESLAGGIVVGLVAGAGMYWVVPRWVIPESQGVRGVLAGLAAVVGIAGYLIDQRLGVRRRLRRYYREMLGSDSPFGVQVELSPEGVCTKQKTGQFSFEWRQVDSIRETADSVDIYGRHGGLVVVRKHAFGSAEELQRFIEEAEGYLAQAQELENS